MSRCPNCSSYLSPPASPHSSEQLSEAQSRIRDLEAQVRLLNSKAAAAVDRLADYEDEIQFLRAQHQQRVNGAGLSPPLEDQPRPQTAPSPQQQPAQPQSRIASLSSLWRKSSPNLNRPGTSGGDSSIPPVPPTPSHLANQFAAASPGYFTTHFPNGSTSNLVQQHPSSPDRDLTAALEAERALRQRAESTLTQTQSELEELTSKLFGEANEMVATERRARAKLEERVRLLEKRDSEKRRRLERLEGAVARIERVRGMVG